MPEMPAVQGLVSFLGARVGGLAVVSVEVGSIAVLKTYDPAPQSLAGAPVDSVSRHGKFLDLDCDGIHLVFHLAKAGWLRWYDAVSYTHLDVYKRQTCTWGRRARSTMSKNGM